SDRHAVAGVAAARDVGHVRQRVELVGLVVELAEVDVQKRADTKMIEQKRMIVVLKANVPAGSPDIARIVTLAESFPGIRTEVHRIEGTTRALTEIYLIGPTHAVPTTPFEEFEAVEKVVRITQRYRSIGRHDSAGLESVG